MAARGTIKLISPKNGQFIEGDIESWYVNDLLHRGDDLPALIDHSKGTQTWWRNGRRHRANDRPALIRSDVSSWWINGNIHRERGPAVISNKSESWFLYGKMILIEKWTRENKLSSWQNWDEDTWSLFCLEFL